jgi:hypothetical protein
MKSLVTFEEVKYRFNSLESGRNRPNGVKRPHGLKSWSAPTVPTRLFPPRENGPMSTGALESRDKRSVSADRAAC